MEDTETIIENVSNNIKEYSLETFERALPDSRDGLKPIHRRILYSMYEESVFSFKKVQKISGSVMGNYHPHGDAAITDSLARMAQPFSLNYPYISGQGNFGSQSGDPVSAARYIEAKLSDFSKDVICQDIDKVSIDYIDNYDYTLKIPEYLPSRIPLLLINGVSGIAEGFITNMPSHNLTDVVNMCIKVIKNRSITNEELVDGIYPDYPTGGEITNGDEISNFYKHDAPCIIKLRASMVIDREHSIIIINDLPYGAELNSIKVQVGKEQKINNMILKGIEDIQEDNKSKRNGRITYNIFCRKEANLIEIMNELYNKTDLSISIPLSFMIYHNNKPKKANIKEIIYYWYQRRVQYKRRKYTNEIAKLENRKHILFGLRDVFPRIDELIHTIRHHSGTKDELITLVNKKFKFTIVQADAICGMSLHSLSSSSLDDLNHKIKEIEEQIKAYDINLTRIDDIIIEELQEIEKKYHRDRQTLIHANYEKVASEPISISRGAFAYTRNSFALFDANGIKESKTLINGMKPVKIDGKNVREILNSISIKDGIKGFIFFYSDGTVNKFSMSDMRVINTWYDSGLEDGKEIYISTATPYYNDDDYILCISSDGKIKKINVDDINKRIVSSGDCIKGCAYIEKDNLKDDILICNSANEYYLLNQEEFPLLGRSASGVKTNFSFLENFYMEKLEYSKINTLLVSTTNTADSQNYMFSVPTDDIETIKRTQKFRKFPLPDGYTVNGFGTISDADKESVIVMIGPASSSILKAVNFRKKYDFKRMFIPTVGIIQLI